MPGEAFLKDLARLVIAAAWIDGELSNSELNTLKDLLFRLPDLTGEEYAELQAFMDRPVGPGERQKILDRVLAGVRSEDDRRLVLRTLTRLVEADGKVTPKEKSFLEAVRRTLDSQGTGLLSNLGRMIRTAVGGREQESSAVGALHIGDYIRNTVYFDLAARMKEEGEHLQVPEARLRKLCLAAGLMGRVAWVDARISDEERKSIEDQLRTVWNLPDREARVVAEMSLSRVMKGLDHFRVCRGFFEATSPPERAAFLKCLFQVANSCGRTSQAEIVEIQKIATSIKVPHRDFLDAKLTIPRDQRDGL